MLNSTGMRRRTGLSHESAISTLNSPSRSKDLPLSSPTVLDKDNDNDKEKETSDKDTPVVFIQRTPSRRSVGGLNIFGATFGGTTLKKNRKPPPRFVDNLLCSHPFSLYDYCY